MSHARRSQEENAHVLKAKVRDLEDEVAKLKHRLDDLRKAKNNTVFKREREVIQVGGPNLGRPAGVETSKYRELEQKFFESEKKRIELEKALTEAEKQYALMMKERDLWKEKYGNLEKETNELREQFQFEIEKIKMESRENAARAEDSTNELTRLLEKLEIKAMQEENEKSANNEREVYIADLINENTTLRMKVETLFNELSEKEARWLESREVVVRKIQEKWDQKYAKWMSETEKKIEDLRAANLVLKKCLAKREDQQKDEDNQTPSTSNSSPDG